MCRGAWWAQDLGSLSFPLQDNVSLSVAPRPSSVWLRRGQTPPAAAHGPRPLDRLLLPCCFLFLCLTVEEVAKTDGQHLLGSMPAIYPAAHFLCKESRLVAYVLSEPSLEYSWQLAPCLPATLSAPLQMTATFLSQAKSSTYCLGNCVSMSVHTHMR